MKLTTEKKPLLDILVRAASVVERKNLIPSLANVALTARNGKLTAVATDLDIEITSVIDANIEIEGATTVNAAMFAQIVAKIPNGALISLSLDKSLLKVSAGRSKYELNTLPIEDFPQIADLDYSHTFTAPAHELNRLLTLSKGGASTEEARYYLQGVYFHPTPDNDLCAVATDGHRLYKITAAHHVTFPGVIIPTKTVNELVKALDLGDVAVSITETKIKFDFGHTVIVSKVIDGTFPDYTRVIPSDNRNIITADANEMKQAADRVAMVSDDRARAVKINAGDGVAVLTTRGNIGTAQEEVPIEYHGPALELGFNSKYLASVLAQCSGAKVTMECGVGLEPVIIRPSDDDGAMYVVMPMRA